MRCRRYVVGYSFFPSSWSLFQSADLTAKANQALELYNIDGAPWTMFPTERKQFWESASGLADEAFFTWAVLFTRHACGQCMYTIYVRVVNLPFL